ncbi:hypothetical protein C8F01DRAFT_1087762 [Mycena amicta]|nr:hypothetical protein C8F01DRAFT_1087762 [Mycena amicta]
MHLPSAFYPADAYTLGAHDMRKPWVRLFRGPFFIRCLERLLGALPDGHSIARLCNVWKVMPRMVGYVAGQLRTMLSKSDWAAKDGKCDYEKLFKTIVELFVQPNLPEWAHRRSPLFGEVYRDAVAPEVDPNAAAEEDDSDDEFAACRRAPPTRSPSPE